MLERILQSLPVDMKKKVLLAIDMEAPASWAASYAVQLAARPRAVLVLMAVFRPRPRPAAEKKALSMAGLREEHRLWLGKIRERCQQEGVEVEIFISAGSFCEEVLRFAKAQSALQFIIMGFPGDYQPAGWNVRRRLYRACASNWKGRSSWCGVQGKVVRLADNSGQRQGREN